jgi:hypothetical protein
MPSSGETLGWGRGETNAEEAPPGGSLVARVAPFDRVDHLDARRSGALELPGSLRGLSSEKLGSRRPVSGGQFLQFQRIRTTACGSQPYSYRRCPAKNDDE